MKNIGGIGALGVRRPHVYPDQLTVAGLIARLTEMHPDRPVVIHGRPARAVVETQSWPGGAVQVEIR